MPKMKVFFGPILSWASMCGGGRDSSKWEAMVFLYKNTTTNSPKHMCSLWNDKHDLKEVKRGEEKEDIGPEAFSEWETVVYYYI